MDPHPQLSHPGILPRHQQIGPAMTLNPNPNPRLAFQASVPRYLVPKPSRLGTPEPHPRTLPATQEETVPFGAMQNLPSGSNLHVPQRLTPPSVPTGPQTWRLTLSRTPSVDSAPRKLPCTVALGGATWAQPMFPDGRDTHLLRKRSRPWAPV